MKFLEEIKTIENQSEDEITSASLFNQFHFLEFMNAFFAVLAIMSSIFDHEFRLRRTYNSQGDSMELLTQSHQVSLAIVTFSVFFFSYNQF
jgi:hypothetical protein